MSSFGEPIASASVELRADSSKLQRDAEDGVLGLKSSLAKAQGIWDDITKDANVTGTHVQKSFETAGTESKAALEKIGKGDEFGNVQADATKATDHVSRSFRKSADESEGHIGRVKDSASNMFRTVAGLAAAAGVGFFLKDAVAQADDAAKSTRELQAVITATGGAAGLTAEQIRGIAQDLSVKIGVDDDAIVKAQSVLLTFKNIGGDSFAAVTQAAADMSAVFGGDLQSSSVQLGKALNDPVQGVSALTRVGIQFTDAQKAQIKAMVEAGDVAGAQGIIMKEVQGQVGGAAEAMASGASKIGVAWGNLKETVGTGLSGALDTLAPSITGIIDGLGPALSTLSTGLGNALGPIIKTVGPVLNIIATQASKVFGDLGTIFGTLAPLLSPIVQIFGVIATAVSGGLATAFKALAPAIEIVAKFLDVFAEHLGGALFDALDAITPALNTIGTLLSGALAQFLPVVLQMFDQLTPILIAIADVLTQSLLQALPGLLAAFQQIAEVLLPLVPLLADGLLSALNALAPILPFIIDALVAWKAIQIVLNVVALAFNVILEANPITLVVIAIAALVAGIILAYNNFTVFHDIVDSAWQIMQKVWDFITNVFVAAWHGLQVAIQDVVGVVQAIWDKTEGLRGFLSGVFSIAMNLYFVIPFNLAKTAVQFVIDIVQAVWDRTESFRGFLTGVFSIAMAGAKLGFDVLKDAVQFVIDVVQAMWDRGKSVVTFLEGSFSNGLGIAKTAFDDVKGAAQFVVDVLKTLWDWAGKVVDAISKIKPPHIPGLGVVGDVVGAINPFNAVGGIFDKPTLGVFGEAGKEAIIPTTMPGRAMQLMSQSGLGEMWDRLGGGGWSGPAVQIDNATFQDATDADLVAQKVNVAVLTRMVAR